MVKSAFATTGSAQLEQCVLGDRYPLEEFEATTVSVKVLIVVAMI